MKKVIFIDCGDTLVDESTQVFDEQDKNNIVMVGNNLRRDIKGANDFGITSIWMNWSPRYFHDFEEESWKPDYEVSSMKDLIKLIENL